MILSKTLARYIIIFIIILTMTSFFVGMIFEEFQLNEEFNNFQTKVENACNKFIDEHYKEYAPTNHSNSFYTNPKS